MNNTTEERLLAAAAYTTFEAILKQLDVPAAAEASLNGWSGKEPASAMGVYTYRGALIIRPTLSGAGDTLLFEMFQPILRWNSVYYDDFFGTYPYVLPSSVDNPYPAIFYALTGVQLEWQGYRLSEAEMYCATDDGEYVRYFEYARYDSREEAARFALNLIFDPTDVHLRRLRSMFDYEIVGEVGKRIIHVVDRTANPDIGDQTDLFIRLDAEFGGDVQAAMKEAHRFMVFSRAEEEFLNACITAEVTQNPVDALKRALLAYWCYTAFYQKV